MIKICHIISGSLWAGAEAMVYHLLKGLLEYEDIELSAILFNEGKLANLMRSLNITAKVLDEDRLSSFEILFKIRKIMLKEKNDIIHTHGYKENILTFLAAKSIRKTKLVATQHGYPEIYGREKNLTYRFLSILNLLFISKGFSRVVSVSKDIQEIFIKRFYFRNDKVTFIHNGIEIPNEIKRKNKKPFVIGSAGRYFPVKNYSLMVEIAKIISEKNNIIFKLAGDGLERQKIEKLIRKYGIEKAFIIKGFTDDITKFYGELDIYINTSLHEGIPMSVLEAMAHGLPIVAPKVGGFKEIIENGIQGFLIDEHNTQDFAEKCLQLYENPKLCKAMGYAAREKVIDFFSINYFSKKYYLLYKTLM